MFFKRLSLLMLIIVMAAFSRPLSTVYALEPAFLITYGSEAKTIEGDDDFIQIIYIRIAGDSTQPFFVRIFDADCGGRRDALFSGKWNTSTRFRLFGGNVGFSSASSSESFSEKSTAGDLNNQKVLADESFTEDPFRDNQWHTLAQINSQDGEKHGKFVYFKLLVEGTSGDDGNIFQIAISPDQRKNIYTEEALVLTRRPTVRLPRKGVFMEMPFHVPADVPFIRVFNFDLFKADLYVSTRFREKIKLYSSGQDKWEESIVELDEKESGTMCAIRFKGGKEIPNDGTFYVTDDKGRLLNMELPFYLHKKNYRAKPEIVTSPLEDCNSFVFDASKTTDPEHDRLEFTWDFGDGTTGQGMRTVHRYESSGRYKASLMVEDDCGLVFRYAVKPFNVYVNHPPEAVAGSDMVVAPEEKIIFDGSGSQDIDGSILRYSWDFGDGHQSRKKKTSHKYLIPGLYTVVLRVEDNSNTSCNFNEGYRKIKVNASPVVRIGKNKSAMAGETIEFSGKNAHDSDGEIIKYKWNFGDGTKTTGMNAEHSFDKPGSYRVVLTVIDDSGVKNRVGWDMLKVIVNDPPLPDMGIAPDSEISAAIDERIAFNASRSKDPDGKITEFSWNFGDGTIETGVKTFHAFKKPGRYVITLTVTDDSGTASASSTVRAWAIINSPPVADGGPDHFVTSSEVSFNADQSYDHDGSITAYEWDFGDGETGSGMSPVHVYQTPGMYTARLVVTDNSGTSDSKSADDVIVRINHLPIADAGPDRVGVPGEKMIFDASGSLDPDGSISKVQWDFGDKTSVSEKINTGHTYEKPGKYTVTLSVWDDSGHENAKAYDKAVITINSPPTPVAGHDKTVAPGDTVVFDGTRSYDVDGKKLSWQWNFSDIPDKDKRNDLFKTAIVKRKFANPGSYKATLTVTDAMRANNSTVSDTTMIRVNHRPEANAGRDVHTTELTVLFDASKSFDPDGDFLIYTWDFGDESRPEIGKKLYHTYKKGGSYPVILTVDDGIGVSNSKNSTSIRVRINRPPKADAGGNRKVCAGKSVIFDGSASNDPDGGLLKYYWDFGDNTSARGVNPTKIYEKGGDYVVTLTVEDDSGLEKGNRDSNRIVIDVSESPVADAGQDQVVCAGAVVNFDGTDSRDVDGLVNNYLWDFGDGSMGGGPTPVHVYSQAGKYRVRLTITGDMMGDCKNTDDDEMSVSVLGAPAGMFDSPPSAEKNTAVQFAGKIGSDKESKIKEWKWDFGDGSEGQGKKISHTYDKSGVYTVTLAVKSDAGSGCDTNEVKKKIIINSSPLARFEILGIKKSVKSKGENEEKIEQKAGLNQMLIFDASESNDPDGVISMYEWDFGDGRSATGVIARHRYKKPGKYEVSLTVTDNTKLGNNRSQHKMSVTVNQSPVAIIDWIENPDRSSKKIKNNIVICPGVPISLSADRSNDPDGQIKKYSWSFGDGTDLVEGKEVTHIYARPGTYTLALEVDDGTQVSNSRGRTVMLVKANNPPVADAGIDRIAAAGEKIMFDGSSSYDKDGKISSWEWDFGDGSVARGKKVGHAFKKPEKGSMKYSVTLKIKDNSETSCIESQDMITVRINSQPVADAGPDRKAWTGGAHDTISFDGSSSYDPDKDALTCSWDFGDGQKASGMKTVHRYDRPGIYKVTLTVNDGKGVSSSTGKDTARIEILKR